MANLNAEALRELAVGYMTGRKSKNSYTQGSKRTYFFGYPDNEPGNTTQRGYSDCSSAVGASIRAASGINIGSNTSAQINNRGKGAVVDQTDGYYPDESRLKPGDCLYFKGNTSHPMDVGHVEMYTGNNECYGHGSGTGPTKKNLRDYCRSRASSRKRYFMAIRWITDGTENDVDLANSTLGDRLLKYRSPLMTGSDVRDLQTLLVSLGYSVGGSGIDGEYGQMTAAAVREFQGDVPGLTADGEYGPLTHAALMRAVTEAEGEQPEDAPETPDAPEADEPVVEITGGTVNVRKGPETGYGVITIARDGERYPHIATARNGWLCIKIGDGTAWVSNKYARLIEN